MKMPDCQVSRGTPASSCCHKTFILRSQIPLTINTSLTPVRAFTLACTVCISGQKMDSDIILIREEKNYRVLYGRLRLTGDLSNADEICIDVKGEGKVKILKMRDGLFVKRKDCRLPVLL